MSRYSRAYAYLSFYGEDFSPQKFSNVLGIQPTSSGLKGEPILSFPALLYKDCFWEYRLPESDDCDGLDEALEKLYQIFFNKTDVISSFMREHDLAAKCCVVLTVKRKENPGLRLTTKFVHFLSELNAWFEMDGYQ
ncbi:protein of unknown function [Hymenobacter daecheongensis DSM 21074]|uniref:DUF4279 domain-containing protein n=1 Tax=Hymenobacter daecheongensis DSM 21074 TaxID=1121955 RepID=A0A1M6HMM4_9BACT|nr:DUF4279 domain-containing protein [Hymenobacter daecheongensis]SHJ23445.1 protein of unknown function [Hymenobacter daecheongensis DSM 21074]